MGRDVKNQIAAKLPTDPRPVIHDEFFPGVSYTVDALKAEFTPPVWWEDVIQLSTVLESVWMSVAADHLIELQAAFLAGSISEIEKIVKYLADVGPKLVEKSSGSIESLVSKVAGKASTFWTIHAHEMGVLGDAGQSNLQGNYQAKLIQVITGQLKAFIAEHPDRIIAPEIQRQMKYLAQSDLTRASDVVRIKEQLERVTSQQRKWEDLSSVQVSRLWHAEGFYMARDHGITYVRITGPLDQKTCPVCRMLVGLELPVQGAIDKFDSYGEMSNIEDYVQEWRFPRFPEIDNMSRDEMRAKVGPFPVPAHCRCRHSYTWVSDRK